MKNILIILCLLFLAFSCEQEKSSYVHLATMKIYMSDNTVNSNVLAFDALKTSDGGAVVFGVGSNKQSKFQGDGRLFVMQTNSNGNVTIAEQFHNIGDGFPAAVVETTDGYNVFWNKAGGEFLHIRINKQTLQIDASTPITINARFTPNYITSAIAYNGGFIVQGTASENIGGIIYKKAFIAQADAGSSQFTPISANEYTPSDFGTFGNEDMAMLQGMRNCFKMLKTETNIYYSAPYDNRVVIKEIGDPEAIFAHATQWLAAFSVNSNNTFSAIFQDTKSNEVKYYQQLDLKSAYINPELPTNSEEVKNVDTDEAINIVTDTGGNKFLIVATNSGQLAIHTFLADGTTNEKIIGQTYPYRPVSAFISGEYLMLIGNTEVSYTYKRVFFMKIPLTEII